MLKVWRGRFGDEYTLRQPRRDTRGVFAAILRPYRIDTVLEVGCNRGDNLAAFGRGKAEGVEPNLFARTSALFRGYLVADATAQDLPFPDRSFDLVFTAGVLIHIPPDELDQALREIHRVAKRYILAIEYRAKKPTPVTYRGIEQGIWKRDYGREYRDRFPDLKWVGVGNENSLRRTPFEGCWWWLLEKPFG